MKNLISKHSHKNRLKGVIKATLPMMALMAPTAIASTRSRSTSRFNSGQGKFTYVAVGEANLALNANKTENKENKNPFGAFHQGEIKQHQTGKLAPDVTAFNFLQDNGLLSATSVKASAISGDTITVGRKQFASTGNGGAHCDDPGGNFTIYTIGSCNTTVGYVWHDYPADPEINVQESGGDVADGTTEAFGNVDADDTATVVKTFTIQETASEDLSVTAISLATSTDFTITGDTCSPYPKTLNNASCTVSVTLKTSVEGAVADTLNISSDDTDEATYNISLTGTGLDVTAPTISATTIPDSAHKVGDTVTATITVPSDTDDYTTGSGAIAGTINGYTLGSLAKTNDTTYTATFTITDGGTDVLSASDVAVNFTLTDSAGNPSSAFTSAISQTSDAIYANLPDFTLSSADGTLGEDADTEIITATITGSLNNQWPATLTVPLSFDDTNNSGSNADYTMSASSITINTGNSSNNVVATGVADTLFDAASAESFVVSIGTLSVGNDNGGDPTISITDAETAPTVTLSTSSATVAENAGTSNIIATLSNATYADVAVSLGYSGTATSGGTDYNTASAAITITAGNITANATTGITAVDDASGEANETIIIDVTGVSGGSASESGVQQQTVTITDDDDTTPPNFDVTPSLSGITTAGATLSVDMNEDGTVYYVVVADGAAIPSATQVKAGQDSTGSAALASGDFTTASTVGSEAFSGLNSLTLYDVYVVAQDGIPNLQTSASKVDLTTLNSAPVNTLPSAPVVTEDINAAIADDINISDSEGGNQTVTLSFTGGTASIATNNLSFSTGDGSNDATMVFSGSLADINTALDAMTFTPALNLNGTNVAAIQMQTDDGNGGTDDDTLQFNIVAVDDAPTLTATADDPTFTENGGAVSLFSSSTVSTVETGQTLSALTLTITNINDGATLGADETLFIDGSAIILTDTNSGTTSTNSLSYAVSLTANTASVSLTAGVLTEAEMQTLVDNITYNNASETPNTSNRVVTFTQLVDSGSSSGSHVNSATLALVSTVTVNAVNDAPTITIANSLTVDEDGNQTLSFSYTDIDGDTVTATEKTVPTNGSISITATDISYTPDADFNGNDTFTVTLTDSAGFSVDKTITVNVSSINDEPVITITNTLTVDEDGNQILSFSYTDIDGDTVTTTEKTAPTNGSISISATDISYTPDANFNGSDTFTVTLTDSAGFSVDKTITVNVSSVNDDPVITITNTLTVDEDGNQTLSFSYTDIDGDTVTATEKTAPTDGSISITATDIVYTPDANFNGSDTFTVTLTDSAGFSVDKTITVNVTNVNDVPVISGTPITTVDQGDSYSFTPSVTDVDSGDTQTFSITNKPAWASFDVTSGALTGTPAATDIGTINDIVISVTDSGNASASLAAFTLQINAMDRTPSLLGIETIEVNANALLTEVDLGAVTAQDYLGETIVAIKPESFLVSGEHALDWQASDANGNEVSAQQIVKIHPLISLGKDAYVKQGEAYTFKVYLNGDAPEYPLEVPYAIYGEDQQAIGEVQTVTITQANKTFAEFVISAELTNAHALIVVELDPQHSITNLNLDAKSSLTLTRITENISPTVGLTVSQDDVVRLHVLVDAGAVNVQATVSDANKDTLATVWTSENNQLSNTSSDQNVFSFNPQDIDVGIYKLSATVTEVGTPELLSNTQNVYINIIAVLPEYLSVPSILPDNVLAHAASDGFKYLLEAEPGTRVTLGKLSLQEAEGGAQISQETIDQDDSIEPDAIENVNVGGLFDFEIHELPINGQSVNMVLPLREAIPENASYRKHITGIGWSDFSEDANNQLFSATGADGYCPPPSSGDYVQGLNAGDWCVRLTIEDGGPNDNDGIANGTIVDPGGISVKIAEQLIENKSGGSMGVFMFILVGMVAGLRRYGKKAALIALSLLSFNGQASDWSIDAELGFSKAQESSSFNEVTDEGVIARDDTGTSWSVGLVYHLNQSWQLAARYIDLGEGSATLKGDTPEYHQTVTKVTPLLVHGSAADLGYQLFNINNIVADARVGVLFWKSDLTSKYQDQAVKHEQSGTDPYLGLQLGYQFNKQWQLAVVYTRYFISQNDIDSLNLKLSYCL